SPRVVAEARRAECAAGRAQARFLDAPGGRRISGCAGLDQLAGVATRLGSTQESLVYNALDPYCRGTGSRTDRRFTCHWLHCKCLAPIFLNAPFFTNLKTPWHCPTDLPLAAWLGWLLLL